MANTKPIILLAFANDEARSLRELAHEHDEHCRCSTESYGAGSRNGRKRKKLLLGIHPKTIR